MIKHLLNLKILNIFFLAVMWNITPAIYPGESSLPPPLPYKPWGTVMNQGADAPVGITLSAWCGGVQYAQTTTTSYDGHTYYAIEIPGDIADTTTVEGCVSGQLVVFKIEGVQTDQSPAWTQGGNAQVNLSYSATHYSFLPLVVRPGSPSSQNYTANPGAYLLRLK